MVGSDMLDASDPDQAAMINAVLQSNEEYMRLIAAESRGRRDGNRSSGDAAGGGLGQMDLPQDAHGRRSSTASPVPLSSASSESLRQRLIAAVAAEVRKQTQQQQQQQQASSSSQTQTPARRPARRRAGDAVVQGENEFDMQHLQLQSDDSPPSAGLTSRGASQQQPNAGGRFMPATHWQPGPSQQHQHFFTPSSQHLKHQSPQQQSHHHSPHHAQHQYTPSHQEHAPNSTSLAASQHLFNDAGYQHSQASQDSMSGASASAASNSTDKSGIQHHSIAPQMRSFGLESPIGLHQHQLSSGRSAEAGGIRQSANVQAMLSARGSVSPTDAPHQQSHEGLASRFHEEISPSQRASLPRMSSAGDISNRHSDLSQQARGHRLSVSSRMVPTGSSPGALMTGQTRTGSPPSTAAASAASAALNSGLGIASGSGRVHMGHHRHTHSLGQVAQVMTTQPGLTDGALVAISPTTSGPGAGNAAVARRSANSSLVPPVVSPTMPTHQQQPRDMLYPGAPNGRQMSSGGMGGNSAMPLRSASPNGSINSVSFTSSSSQHSRAVSSQSSVLSGFSKHNADSSFGSSADTSMETSSRGPSRACSTSEQEDLMSIHSSIDVETTNSSIGTPSVTSASNSVAGPADFGAFSGGLVGGKRSKTKIDDWDRKRICEYAAAHPRQKQGDIAAVFDIERSTVSKILKKKEKWLAMDFSDSYLNRDRSIRHPDLETYLLDWTRKEEDKGRFPDNAQLRAQIKEIAETRSIHLGDDFTASDSWLDSFRLRNKVIRPGSQPPNSGAPTLTAIPLSTAATISTPSRSLPPATPARLPAAAEMPSPWESASTSAQHQHHGLGIHLQHHSNQSMQQHGDTHGDFVSKRGPQEAGSDMESQREVSGPSRGFETPRTNIAGPLGTGDGASRVGEERRREAQLLRSFSDTDLSTDTQTMQTPTKRRKGPGGAAISPSSFGTSLYAPAEPVVPSGIVSPRTAARRKQEALRKQREQQDSAQTGGLKLDLRGIESVSPRQTSTVRGSERRMEAESSEMDSMMEDGSAAMISGTTLLLPARRLRQLSGESAQRGSPLLGEDGQAVSIDEARESLDVVLRFLREQPEDFCPREHYLVFGHLQGSLAAGGVNLQPAESRSGPSDPGT